MEELIEELEGFCEGVDQCMDVLRRMREKLELPSQNPDYYEVNGIGD